MLEITLPGATQRMQRLSVLLTPVLVTADTLGTAEDVAGALGAELTILEPGHGAQQKLRLVQGLGPEITVAIGNGRNDQLMVRAAALGIAMIPAEGTAVTTIQQADLVFTSVTEGLGVVFSDE